MPRVKYTGPYEAVVVRLAGRGETEVKRDQVIDVGTQDEVQGLLDTGTFEVVSGWGAPAPAEPVVEEDEE